MNTRELGRTGLRLSALTFGSMRLSPTLGAESALRLLEHLYEGGVTTFHSSHEYETHPFFCEVFERFRRARPGAGVAHIAKIAAPHFEEDAFDASRFRALVEARLTELGAERLDVVQWLVRSKPIADAPRLARLKDGASRLARVWEELVAAGKVGALTSFPYSRTFAEAVLTTPPCAGLTTYLNLSELEMAPLLDGMERVGQGFVAIRPLFAGALVTAPPPATRLDGADDPIAFALRFPLLHPAVASVIVSVSSLAHADAALEATRDVTPDAARFDRIVSATCTPS